MFMKKYVAGFLFSQDRTKVALIRKNKPEWQEGKLNGIGGKIEPFEHELDAMEREFREETGVSVKSYFWNLFASIQGEDYVCHFFRAFDDSVFGVKSMEEEQVCVLAVNELHNYAHIPNLKWLIPLALDTTIVHAAVEDSGN